MHTHVSQADIVKDLELYSKNRRPFTELVHWMTLLKKVFWKLSVKWSRHWRNI